MGEMIDGQHSLPSILACHVSLACPLPPILLSVSLHNYHLVRCMLRASSRPRESRKANRMPQRSQKYSIYLPIHRPSRSTSRAASTATHGTRSPKGSDRKSSRSSAAAAAAAAAQSSAKRRSTMNSRDAAYDEEEQLRRAIEASKEDTITEEPEPPSRRPKRGRDDEEECVLVHSLWARIQMADLRVYRHAESIIKRQRTNSKSPTPLADQAPLASREDSDDEVTVQNGLSRKSSSRNTARTQRERTERDERREEQERKRAEAASKRKGRAERRRAEGNTAAMITIANMSRTDLNVDGDSDPSEEIPLVTRTVVNRATESVQPPDLPASSQPAPDTPPASGPQSSTQTKKKAAPQPKKKGRNQYTKDRDPHEQDTSPARSMSRDISRNQDDNGTAHNKSTPNEGSNKHHSGKTKGIMSSKVAMGDLKRRANNILEYITRTQVELANEPLSEKNSPQRAAADDVSAVPMLSIQHSGQEKSNCIPNAAPADFKDLSCVEMMDYLTRDLVKWQHEYAS